MSNEKFIERRFLLTHADDLMQILPWLTSGLNYILVHTTRHGHREAIRQGHQLSDFSFDIAHRKECTIYGRGSDGLVCPVIQEGLFTRN